MPQGLKTTSAKPLAQAAGSARIRATTPNGRGLRNGRAPRRSPSEFSGDPLPDGPRRPRSGPGEADGNPVLLISLGLTVVTFPKWLRWSLTLWAGIAVVSAAFLALAVAIGLGPF